MLSNFKLSPSGKRYEYIVDCPFIPSAFVMKVFSLILDQQHQRSVSHIPPALMEQHRPAICLRYSSILRAYTNKTGGG